MDIAYLSSLLATFAVAAVLALSINMVLGSAGLLWVAQGGLAGVGAYTAAYLATRADLPVIAAIAVGALAAGACGLLCGLLLARLEGADFVLGSLALQSVIIEVFAQWQSVTGGTNGLGGIPRPSLFGFSFTSPGRFAVFCLVVVALVSLVATKALRTRFGLDLRAMRHSPRAVLASGRSVVALRIRILAFGGVLAGIGGGLLAVQVQYLTVSLFDLSLCVSIITYVVIGGVGNNGGALLGAAVMTALPSLVQRLDLVSAVYVAPVQQALVGVALMAFVLLRPRGILPERPLISTKRAAAEADPGMAVRSGIEPSALVVRDLSVRFGGLLALDGVSLRADEGQITAVIGPNGAGKSTLLNAMTGFVRPQSGAISAFAKDVTALSPDAIARRGLARTFQDLEVLGDLTVLENVVIGFRPARRRGSRRSLRAQRHDALRICRSIGIAPSADRLARDLGYGEQKLVVLARLIAADSPVVLLDEPGSGLPADMVERLGATLRELAAEGRTVVLVDHNMSLIMEVADVVHVLESGRNLVSGKPAEVSVNPEVIRVYLTGATDSESHDAGAAVEVRR